MQRHICLFGLLLIGLNFLGAEKEARLLRFPAIYDRQIVFTYAGDLYIVASEGGTARKLTTHAGYEMFARFSPDGKHIAFTGQYDGNTEVYLMPASGGAPKRLTYTAALERDYVWDRMGPDNIVIAWKDSEHIVFRSRMHSFDSFVGQLYSVALDGSLPVQLPLPRGGFCSFSPDGNKLAYNRIFREFRTWKRYRGGMADDIWVYDFADARTINVTNNPAQDIIPMWHENKIYFLSDRDKTMNLYACDLNDRKCEKLTDFTEFDIKFPSLGPRAIVFENGGYLYRFDLATGKYRKVPVFIRDDMLGGREKIVEVASKIDEFDISPDGKRALLGARGEIFTVPAKYGDPRNMTKSCGVHERDAQWSPDGRSVAYISDKSGEDEIYVIPADGSSAARAATLGAKTYKYRIKWSFDSKKILWSDKKLRLRYADVNDGKITEIDQAKSWEIRDYSWSPDSKWVCYSRPETQGMTKIYLYSLEQKKNFAITEGRYSCDNPTFSRDGKYLFFASARDFDPSFGRLEWNYAYLNMERLYLVTLAADQKSPFYPKSDEAACEQKASKKPQKPLPITVKIDICGLAQRVEALPVKPASYWMLTSVGNSLYYMRRGEGKSSLCMFDFDKLKETILATDVSYRIAAGGKKMLIVKGDSFYIIDLPTAKIEFSDPIDLSKMKLKIDYHQEWLQIFDESWRQMREFFYAPNMHGLNWKQIREKYRPLIKYVNHRADLTYIIGEMIGELSVGHSYTGGGDVPDPKKIPTGLLGAKLKRDKSGYYRIEKILKGQNWNKHLRSPFTATGVVVHEGEYIISVNGESTATMSNIYRSLVDTVGSQVTLEINVRPEKKGSRKETIIPIANEAPLYYYNWVEENIRKVDKATGGKVGYIHIPDMDIEGLNEFAKYFYPQLRKKALIVDVRNNGGGWVSPLIIERLRREIALIEVARNTTPTPDPSAAVYGPKVCLVNEFSASDGDIFTYRFKRYKLGKVIGKRSWGGVVGIRESLPLIDGGYLYKPEFAAYDADGGGWIIEGHGVDPDIVVDNDPAKEYRGIDEQLDKAIEVILEELKKREVTIPPIPEYPKK